MLSFNIKDILLILVLIAVFVLVVYLILLVKKLLVTVDKANKVLDDGSVVSAIAAKDAVKIDGVITNISGTVNDMTNDISKNQGIIKTATSVGKAAASAASFIKGHKGSEVEDIKETKKKKKGIFSK